jgi:hypothetical protein
MNAIKLEPNANESLRAKLRAKEKVSMYVKGGNLLLSFLLLGALACKADTRVADKSVGGACPLLSASDIQAIQGETVADAQGSERVSDSLSTAQCFYRLPTFSKSVNLEVMRPVGQSAHAVEEFWERRFGAGREEEEREMEAEREFEKKRAAERKDERKQEAERDEEASVRPQPVAGLGDAAYWSGNQLNSSLYVRKNNVIVRLSIGGPEEQSAKIKKATALAEKVLSHL